MKNIIAWLALSLSASAFAGEQIGSWEAIIDGTDIQIAKTTNTAGAATGVLCFVSSNNCAAYIASDVECEDKGKYPLMINSSTGASTTHGTCVTIAGSKVLVLDDFQSAIASFEGGGEIGFAIPMQSGKFNVIRFDCAGATAAIRKARAVPSKAAPATKNPASQVL